MRRTLSSFAKTPNETTSDTSVRILGVETTIHKFQQLSATKHVPKNKSTYLN